MTYILQVDFQHDGPFGDNMVAAFTELAESINEEQGFIWKIWTENEETKEAGGIYLFETEEDAERYLAMHTDRLTGFGVPAVNAKIFKTNAVLSKLNRGPIR
ncbi:monooxygenase [Sporosarcina sp. 179-K 3D1 HS]|uniref:monooxygenase n=1 Tax=Sporosarcina sp. 179-K 3D1 HS TaxID=3232169 RepID=UPI00399F9C34